MSEITLDRIYKKVRREFVINILQQKNDPSFLIIGAQKAATSSLAYYLNQHPDFVMAINKEVSFFDRDENYSKGISWYKKQFIPKNLLKSNYLYFEATPEYMYRQNAVTRIKEHYPDMKLVVLLRDPVERAYSAWNMYSYGTKKKLSPKLRSGFIQGTENQIYKEFYSSESFPEFEKCIEKELLLIDSKSMQEEPSILRRGIYITQLKNLFYAFLESQILILGFKDVIQSPKDTLNKILLFLKQPVSDWNFLIREKRNARGYTNSMKNETRFFLNEFYAPHNEELFNKLGYMPNW